MRTAHIFSAVIKQCSSLYIAGSKWVWSSLLGNMFKWLLVNYYLSFFPYILTVNITLTLVKEIFNLQTRREHKKNIFFLNRWYNFHSRLECKYSLWLKALWSHIKWGGMLAVNKLTWKSRFSGRKHLGSSEGSLCCSSYQTPCVESGMWVVMAFCSPKSASYSNR